jgi:hypothetical protein
VFKGFFLSSSVIISSGEAFIVWIYFIMLAALSSIALLSSFRVKCSSYVETKVMNERKKDLINMTEPSLKCLVTRNYENFGLFPLSLRLMESHFD